MGVGWHSCQAAQLPRGEVTGLPLSPTTGGQGLCSASTIPTLAFVRVSESEGPVLLYILAIATACAGLLQWPIWSALIGGTAIAAVNIAEQERLRVRFAAVGASEILTAAHLVSLAIGWLGGSAAWLVGRLSWWAYWS